MHRLVYLSEAVGDFGAKEVAQIIEVSRRFNARLGITGVLLYHEGRIFQELEGERGAVTRAFNRIKRDKRHKNIQVVEFGPAKRRAFEGWSLGCDHPDALPGHMQRSAFSIFDLIAPDAPMRGARPKVREDVRAYLAGFRWLRTSAGDHPWF
ncbi:MAG: BLUF domain-containing protein [Maritimibacter sp.]